MVRVKLQHGKYTIYVYPETGGRHHEPHCHVEWSDGSTSVFLPSLLERAGTPLPRDARRLLRDNMSELCDEWARQNPERSTKQWYRRDGSGEG